MSLQLTPQEITSAAERIVAAYSAMDDGAYFASFDPQATFIFHGTLNGSLAGTTAKRSGAPGCPKDGK